MFLIIDEDCPVCLVRYATSLGHTAERSVHVPGLRRGAPDAAIWAFAQAADAVLVTRNFVDFLPLAVGAAHAGVVALPATDARSTVRLFTTLMTWIAGAPFSGAIADHFVQITHGRPTKSAPTTCRDPETTQRKALAVAVH
jgi:predicted nuclease of predicted toxin-antitoxin system